MSEIGSRKSVIRPGAGPAAGPWLLRAGLAAGLAACLVGCLLIAAPQAHASKTQWSIFEDHPTLVRSGPIVRDQTLDTIKGLGADTLRIEVKWAEVAPSPTARKQPAVDTTDPGVYPGFQPYDDLVVRAVAKGFRVMITLAPDAPRWATSGGRGGNYKISAPRFAAFARAVGRRYSGSYGGLPAVGYWSIWNEPNHIFFLKPRAQSARVYRGMVQSGVPALRATAPKGAKIFVGELAPVGTATKVIGPLRFMQQWLCLDSRFKRLRGRAAARQGCKHFKKVNADGFAHHPYGPTTAVPRRRDIINMLAIRRLGSALDKAGRAGRIRRGLPIYSTEFGYQTNPPDPFVSTSPARQAELLNKLEEYSYRYARLKSYSQYLLFDDVARSGSSALRWAGFQTGLRFSNGKAKPAFDAYMLALVVHKRRGGVSIWGHVRPGTGTRYVQLQRRSGGSFVDDGSPIRTNSRGYFTATRKPRAQYRYQAFGGPPSTAGALGLSRAAVAR
jgi:Cellulase (glycosyl hydrolase family 5)